MREMKNSGIPWIGDIPSDWITVSFKSLVRNVTTGLNPRDNFELSKDAEFYYVTIRNFKDGKLYLDENCDRIDRRAWEIIQSRSELQKGDILFASISKDAQCYILTEYPNNWNINESVFALRGNYEKVYDKYLYYSLINPEYYNDLRIDATGTTFQSIKQKKLKDSTLLLPPLSEQKAIADFLDVKCAEIDEMISLQEKIIEELKAYKQSVITEAVTKGLNPDAQMKDSGVEWIGEIPEHWETRRMKFIGDAINGLTYSPADVCDNGVLVLRSSNIQNGKLCFVDNVFVPDCPQNLLVRKGDIIICSRNGSAALVGKSAIVEEDMNACFGAFMMRFRSKYYYRYIYYLLTAAITQYRQLFSTTTINQLTLSVFANLNMPFIGLLDEQKDISNYLDIKCSEIDSLISLKQSKIEHLRAYKKSLIYEYVTGKKEVEA